jgi:hypothetical protein
MIINIKTAVILVAVRCYCVSLQAQSRHAGHRCVTQLSCCYTPRLTSRRNVTANFRIAKIPAEYESFDSSRTHAHVVWVRVRPIHVPLHRGATASLISVKSPSFSNIRLSYDALETELPQKRTPRPCAGCRPKPAAV